MNIINWIKWLDFKAFIAGCICGLGIVGICLGGIFLRKYFPYNLPVSMLGGFLFGGSLYYMHFYLKKIRK
jgi:hypothetical protein